MVIRQQFDMNEMQFGVMPGRGTAYAIFILKQISLQCTLPHLKAQLQIWDILQGVGSLGVKFTRKILAWYDK